MNNSTPRCIVIGAGFIGSACAWHLQRRGAQVTLIDPVSPGQSTSYGNAGCISPSSVFPFSYPGAIRQVPGWLRDPLGPMRIRWPHLLHLAPWFWRFWRAGESEEKVGEIAAAQYSLMTRVKQDYDEILSEIGATSLRRTEGMILLYGNEAEWIADRWHFEYRDRFGFPWQRLTAAEVKSMEPAVQLGAEGFGVLDPTWEHLLAPGDVANRFAQAAIGLGTRWVQDRVSTVSSSEDGVSAQTVSGQRFDADYLVVAAGVWSNDLLKQFGHRVPLMAKRGYHSMLARPNMSTSRPLLSVFEYIVMTPMRDGLRVAGTAEFARIDAPPDYRRAKVLLKHAQRFLPGIAGESVQEWMGQRPMMPDSKPVLGPLPGRPRVLCAMGHGHYGLTQAPTTGRIIADLVYGRTPDVDLRPFAADRF